MGKLTMFALVIEGAEMRLSHDIADTAAANGL